MSAFDELQRQLSESIARRGEQQSSRRRGWRSRRRRVAPGPRRGLLLLVVPLVFVAAAAAATIASHSNGDSVEALTNRVLILAQHRAGAPCRTVGGHSSASLSDEAPDPRITALLPQLATPPQDPPTAETVRLAEHNGGGVVLARTIREVHMLEGVTLIVFVAHGFGPFTPVNPQQCLAARLTELARLRPVASDPLRQTVTIKLRSQPDTLPGVQSLSLFHNQQGHIDGGGSMPLLPTDRTLHTGISFWGYSCQPRCAPTLYGGIVGPKVAYLTLSPPGHGRRRSSRRIPVIDGLFAFKLTRGGGREILTQRSRDGRALHSEKVPGTELGAGERKATRDSRPMPPGPHGRARAG